VQVKVLEFLKVDFTKLFIITAMIIGKDSKVKLSWSIDEDSPGKPLIELKIKSSCTF
jgi:hypothetical protein